MKEKKSKEERKQLRQQRRESARMDLRRKWREERAVVIVYYLLRFMVIGILVAQALNQNYENVFMCLLTLVLLTMPSMIERHTHIDLPGTLEIIILLFIFAAEILGEIRAYYVTYQGWDTMLHTINGFLCAAIGFSMVELLNRNERTSLHLSPLYVAIAAFCFSMTIGVLWEFFEFAMDQFIFRMDMQKDTVVHSIASVALDPTNSNRVVRIQDITDTIVVAGGQEISLGLGGYLDIGLIDTMKDLFVNFIGAVCFSVIGFYYVKNRGKSRFASRFIPRVKTDKKPLEERAEEEPSDKH